MKVNLDDLFWVQSRDLLDYCQAHNIDLARTLELKEIWASPIRLASDDTHWILDIPQAHVNWLTLKGIL